MVTEYITKEQAIAAAKRGIRISVNSFVSTKEEIEAIKAADVRPVVRGRWDVVSFRNVRTGVLKKCVCSVCSFTETYFKKPNFCPNCGADMMGGADG